MRWKRGQTPGAPGGRAADRCGCGRCGLTRQLTEQHRRGLAERAGFHPRRLPRQSNTLCHVERRPSALVFRIQHGALVDEQLDDTCPPGHGVVQGRQPVVVGRVYIRAARQAEPDGIDRVRFGTEIQAAKNSLARAPASTGRQHQHRGLILLFEGGIGAGIQQPSHHVDIGEARRPHQGRRALGECRVTRPSSPAPTQRDGFERRIRVRALVQQQRDQIERIELIEGSAQWPTLRIHLARVKLDGRVERRHACCVRHVWIGTPLDQHASHVMMGVDDRDGQCRRAVRILNVQVRAGVGQRFRCVDCTLPRREHQGRETTLWRRQRGVRREVVANLRELERTRTRVSCGTVLDEQLDDIGVIFSGCPHQRRFATPHLGRIHSRTRLEEHSDGFRVARTSRGHEHSFALRRRIVGIGACLEQCVDQHRTSIGGGQRQRRHSQAIGERDCGASPDERRCDRDIVGLSGPMKRRRAVAFAACSR